MALIHYKTIQEVFAVAYSGFHGGGGRIFAGLLTQSKWQTMFSQFFPMAKRIFVAKAGPWPNCPSLNMPLSI